MDVFILILSELLTLLVTAAAFLLAGILAALLISALALSYRRLLKRNAEVDRRQSTEKRRDLLRRILPFCVGTMAFLFVTLMIIHTFFFGSLVSYLLRKSQANTGVSVVFEKASGSLFRGTTSIKNARILRMGHASTNLDLTVDQVDVDLNVFTLFDNRLIIESLYISGARGTIERVAVVPKVPKHKHFEVHNLAVTNSSIRLVDLTTKPSAFEATVEIEKADVLRLRSDWAFLDLLTRSNGKGLIQGQPWAIHNSAELTEITAKALPAGMFAPYVGGPVRLIQSGTVDVAMKHQKSDKELDVKLDCAITLNNVQSSVPADWPILVRTILQPVVSYTNGKSKVPIAFTLVLDKAGFESSTSPESVDFWRVTRRSLIQTIADETKIPAASIEKALDTVLDFIKKPAK
ncbi:MAG TPA: hypothetical protein VEK08_10080 [Planctomycetota bacterium]|nr:hypothetical protein [Planctomycetota bacterium]